MYSGAHSNAPNGGICEGFTAPYSDDAVFEAVEEEIEFSPTKRLS